MMILREALIGTATLVVHGQTREVQYTRKPALYAQQCCACGRAFRMYGDDRAGTIHGTFDPCSTVRGNMFSAQVCSFTCAETIMAGGWKKLSEYDTFVQLEATMYRAEVLITNRIMWAADLIEEWEASDELVPELTSRFK